MLIRNLLFLFVVGMISIAALPACAQTQDEWFPFPDQKAKSKDDDRFVRQMLNKLRSEKEKKDYEEMLQRGEEAFRIATQLHGSFEKRGTFNDDDQKRLAELESLLKKIREELGASESGNDGESEERDLPSDTKGAIEALVQMTWYLSEEIKKSTRFSISVAAIESSNSIMKLIRILKLEN